MVQNFTQRADAFWDWFIKNEKQIEEYTTSFNAQTAAQIPDFIDQGMDLLGGNVFFNLGLPPNSSAENIPELNFTAENNVGRLFLYDHLISRTPLELKDKWRINSGMPGVGNIDFKLRLDGLQISSNDFLIAMEKNNKSARIDLEFYNENLIHLDKTKYYHAFSLMLHMAVGERLSNTFIGNIKPVQEHQKDMFRLPELKAKLEEAISLNGQTPDPAQQWAIYSRQPETSRDIYGCIPLRLDIILGTTNYLRYEEDFVDWLPRTKAVEPQEILPTWEEFESFGAKPTTLYWYLDEIHPYDERGQRAGNPLETRNEIWDKLEEQALGEGPNKTGIALGAAIGHERAYIDLLLYDPEAFKIKAKEILANFPATFFYTSYKPWSPGFFIDERPFVAAEAGDLEPLSNLADKLNKCIALPEELQFAILELFPGIHNLEFVKKYGLVLMGRKLYKDALDFLMLKKEAGAKDVIWNQRVGRCLYQLHHLDEAIPYLEKGSASVSNTLEARLFLEAAKRGISPAELQERQLLYREGLGVLEGDLGNYETRFERFYQWGRHDLTIIIIDSIPAWETDFELIIHKARALNNLDREKEAIQLLETVSKKGERDKRWLYRYAYALYYGAENQEQEAARLLKKALRKDPDYQSAIDLLERIKKDLLSTNA